MAVMPAQPAERGRPSFAGGATRLGRSSYFLLLGDPRRCGVLLAVAATLDVLSVCWYACEAAETGVCLVYAARVEGSRIDQDILVIYDRWEAEGRVQAVLCMLPKPCDRRIDTADCALVPPSRGHGRRSRVLARPWWRAIVSACPRWERRAMNRACC